MSVSAPEPVLLPLVDTAMIWLFKLVVDQVLVPQDFGPFVWIAAAYIGLTALAVRRGGRFGRGKKLVGPITP